MFKKDDLVTVTLEETNKASNTFVVEGIMSNDEDGPEGEDQVVLKHPLYPNVFVIKRASELNKVQANLKDSTERSLEFGSKYDDRLGHEAKGELEALRLYFVVNRSLTNRQKNQLSNICGNIASIYFHNDVALAMRYVIENNAVLDDFNRMWYMNFKDLFFGKKPIESPKQRASIFNIAGFVLAELESQKTKK